MRAPLDPDLHSEKVRSLRRFVLAVLVVLLGVRAVGTPWALTAFPIVVVGVFIAGQAFARLARLAVLEREILTDTRAAFAHQFRRSTLPKQVYWLLLAIAEADGEAGAKEQQLVREFVVERFPPERTHDIADWHAARSQRPGVRTLANILRGTLTRSETETLFFWACLVAFVDQRFNDYEQAALKEAALGLGFDATHARRIFWHAKHAYLGSEASNGHGAGAGDGGRPPRQAAPNLSARQRALQILGLDESANADAIRRRHRELAKKFHPDRHIHLGEAAAKEAAARFREVQGAYEVLRVG
jgi:tellurite resistance protein